jgi:ribonuclease HI
LIGENTVVENSFVAYFDGACEPTNPGGVASFGAVIFHNGEPVWKCSEIYVPEGGVETSNNIAEYAAFLAVLEWFANQNLFDADILIRGDSMLVINQMFGDWKIKKGLYAPLAYEARKLVAQFRNIRGEWIRRQENGVADELSKVALKRVGVRLRLQPA